MTPVNAATALATTVVDELVRGGLRHLVLSPGSRSAAIAFAAHRAAEDGRLTLHTRLDERTAAFLALGIARASRTPVAVLSTSGTAAAHLHAAVLEASHAGVALVVLTADRPARLRGTGANQTTDQVGLFGGAVRLDADVPAPAPRHREDEQVRAWRSLAARVVLTATGHATGPRGPVHLNLQVDGPQTPDATDGWSTRTDGRLDDAPWTTAQDAGAYDVVDLSDPRPTVVVAGDDAGPPARVLAEGGGWPLLAEPSSGARTGANAIRTYRLLLGDDDLAGRIERVVVGGHPTLSRPVTRLLSRPDVEVVALRGPGEPAWTDPGHTVSRVVTRATAAGLVGTAWLQEWLDRDETVAAALDALLEQRPGLTPHEVAGEVAAALPDGGLLHVGASNPVRDLDLMVPRYPVGGRRLVVANRGLAGIDGTISSAVGAALGRPRSTRSLALVGDVTFLHDLTGLVIGPQEQRPDLTVVVVNDDGGSIFASLEQGAPEHASAYDRLFGTPHGADLAALCAGTGTPHTLVTSREQLRSALARAPRGIEVVEARVRRDDRRDLDAVIRSLVRD